MKCDCFIIIFYGEKTMDLFEYAKSKTLDQESPLASRLRPTTLDEVVGQQHIIGKNTLLYRAIKADKLTSVIFYGPPGTGKTTLGVWFPKSGFELAARDDFECYTERFTGPEDENAEIDIYFPVHDRKRG